MLEYPRLSATAALQQRSTGTFHCAFSHHGAEDAPELQATAAIALHAITAIALQATAAVALQAIAAIALQATAAVALQAIAAIALQEIAAVACCPKQHSDQRTLSRGHTSSLAPSEWAQSALLSECCIRQQATAAGNQAKGNCVGQRAIAAGTGQSGVGNSRLQARGHCRGMSHLHGDLVCKQA
jgi:hypothetical protein